jgi:hypothetical protein
MSQSQARDGAMAKLALSRRAMATGLGAISSGAFSSVSFAMAADSNSAPFAENLQSLGWWMRRTTGKVISDLTPFYEQVLGLPLIRAWEQSLVLLWAGEDQVFEVKTDDNPARVQSDPASAALIPVFRVHDLPRWRARMQSFGYAPVAHRRSSWGETLFYRGPDQLLTGFEQRATSSPLPSDRMAVER